MNGQRGLYNPEYCPPKANLDFSIDVQSASSGKDQRKTVMLRNIPNSLTQKEVMGLINEDFRGSFDFFYLPIDFKWQRNVGYAFLNLDSP